MLKLSALVIFAGCSNSTDESDDGESVEFDGLDFVWIPPGTFMMGSPKSESEWYNTEKQHRVTISQGFWIGRFEVTQEQWKSVMGKNPSYFSGKNNPVESVSWDDIQVYLSKLNKSSDGYYRLPTEAEWEYACRAGATTAYHFGSDSSNLGDYAWTFFNSSESTHPVGAKKPNSWGLYDMHGNVREWCGDWYTSYPSDSVTDPVGPTSGYDRINRGGSFLGGFDDLRAASRGHVPNADWYWDLGFRLVRTQ